MAGVNCVLLVTGNAGRQLALLAAWSSVARSATAINKKRKTVRILAAVIARLLSSALGMER